MSRKKRVIWTVVIAALLFVFWFNIVPRIVACYFYSKMSEQLDLKILSIKPQKIQLPEPNDFCPFSLGFAEMSLCPDSISSIRYNKDTGITCEVDSNDTAYIFLLPNNPPDINLVKKYSTWNVKNWYELQLKMVCAMPKTYSEIFFSNPIDSIIYMFSSCLFKTSHAFYQRGIGVFETEDIKGFIGFGTKGCPGNLMAEIFSKDENVSQSITVGSESPEKSKEMLLSLLALYRFTISQASDSNHIDELIINQFSGDSRFEIDEPNE